MALNLSHRPVFPAHLSEDKLVSPMRGVDDYFMEGISERNGNGYVGSWHSHWEFQDCFGYGMDGVDKGGSPESVSKDIVDLLPSDPFEMDISSTFTAITGLLEVLEFGYAGFGVNNFGANIEDYDLFPRKNWIYNSAVTLQTYSGNMHVERKSDTASQIDGCIEKELEKALLSFNNDNICGVGPQIEESDEVNGSCSGDDGGDPHEGFVYALGFLGVRDLLSVERVCRSLRFTVQSDPLLWRNIHIHQPLNESITNDDLLQLTSRAQGNLQCLSLVECPLITDDALKRVLETNPRLTKLCVPGCIRLSIEGVINSLKNFKSKGAPGVKNLRVGMLCGITPDHFKELKFLLGADGVKQQNAYKPHFHQRGNFCPFCDDDRPIDIEVCPRCQKLNLVYDCPFEGCQGKDNVTQVCRACKLCIPRCVHCGRCINENENEYEETFCLELLCSECFKQPLDDEKVGPSKNASLSDSNHNFCLHG